MSPLEVVDCLTEMLWYIHMYTQVGLLKCGICKLTTHARQLVAVHVATYASDLYSTCAWAYIRHRVEYATRIAGGSADKRTLKNYGALWLQLVRS